MHKLHVTDITKGHLIHVHILILWFIWDKQVQNKLHSENTLSGTVKQKKETTKEELEKFRKRWSRITK